MSSTAKASRCSKSEATCNSAEVHQASLQRGNHPERRDCFDVRGRGCKRTREVVGTAVFRQMRWIQRRYQVATDIRHGHRQSRQTV